MASVYQLGSRSGNTRGCYYTNVPREVGAPAQRSTGTQDARTARRIAEMIDKLGPRGERRWDILNAVTEKRISLAQVWDFYSNNNIEKLQSRLNDVDLSELVEDFAKSHATKVTPAHAELAKTYIRRFLPNGTPFLRSSIRAAQITEFLDNLEVKSTAKQNAKRRNAASGTKLKHYAALSAFFRWAMTNGLLNDNPMRFIQKPKPGKARNQHLSFNAVLRLVEATPPSFQAIEALAHCGMEVSAILRLSRGDVNFEDRTVHAKGTKTNWRDRKVPIQEWAIPHIRLICRAKHPAAELFPGIDRSRVYHMHESLCKKLGPEFAHYRFHDARRSFAITALKNGATHESVSYILGHKDAALVLRVYGRYAPNLDALRNCDPSASIRTDKKTRPINAEGAK
jgi:integrase